MWGAWLAQLEEYTTISQGHEFKPHIRHGGYLKKIRKKKVKPTSGIIFRLI